VDRARIFGACDSREKVMIESKQEFAFFVVLGLIVVAAGVVVVTRFI